MIFKDYYKILELNDNNVTTDEIKFAYREQAKKYHPDINSENSFSEERFKDINEAYKVLSNPSSRRKYDRTWNSRIGRKIKKEENKREGGSFVNNLLNMFFGSTSSHTENNKKNKNKIPKKGENIDGKMKTFTVKIPIGIRKGEKIRLLGQGKKGENGANNGDLFIKINILNSKKFYLKGLELCTDLLLTPWEASLGTRATVDTIDDTISLYIPQGIQSGEKIRIPGKGYHNGKGGRGDLVLNIKIMVPKKLSDEEKQLFEKLSQISTFNPKTEVS